ncbi:Threonine/homoserine efflux transporter RhtA [Duganella sp. CF458]|uniref:DMT family transporter n=1 Tax=Duganella sp. CF458 TaxID=1884368 RepID=UPI0008EFE771|nr:DMT family transporter [Duganella sp. CF458]SFG01702.1 Threonine/homoserine efflux transporter RhtA [Duganella sp. CF458]
MNISLGIIAGIIAGAFWGLVFLAPELTRGFTPIQLSAGRYVAYGLIAAILVSRSWRRLFATLTWREWKALAWLSFTGNIIYYFFLAKAVQTGGIAMASIVIGLLPVVITLVGSRDAGAVPLRSLLPSIALSTAGLSCISWQHLQSGSPAGLLYASGALASWTAYAVGNSRWLARLQSVTPHEWSMLTGLVTGAEALLLAVPALSSGAPQHSASEWLYFAAVVTSVAILCSIIGNGFWNYASRALPLTLTGQMIVFETLFAALYGFLWEARWPTIVETLAMGLLVSGVASCALAHGPKRTSVAPTL